jgi:molybdopterin-guanine dinucleotide biosynthesis protein A
MGRLSNPTAVLVLAGGEGRRLGADKAWLEWQGHPLLVEVVGRLEPLAPGAVWVAARADQELPAGSYRRADDLNPGAGPLAGLAAGLAAIVAAGLSGHVAVSACDYPFADPRTFHALAAAAPAAPLVLPRWDGHLHPLQALWHTGLAEACRAALDRGERRVLPVLEAAGATIVDAESLRGELDPERALLNLNDRESLARARRLADAAG